MRKVALSILTTVLLVSAGPRNPDQPVPRVIATPVRRYINIPFNSGSDWLQFNSSATEGNSQDSMAVSASNVGQLRREWQIPLPEPADGSPAYASKVDMDSGTLFDMLFITTTAGRLLAIDAHLGEILWSTTPPAGPRWTTSSPAVDPGRQYVYSYALDGHVHKYSIRDGREVTDGGWPELITLKGDVEKGSSALSIATARNGTTYLYMTIAAYPDPGDAGDYQGHLVAIDLSTGKQNTFNALCSDKAFHFVENGDDTNDCSEAQSGIWARAGTVYDPVTDRLFVTTGNGTYDANQKGFNWGSSVVALRPDGSTDQGTPLDSYTPRNFQTITDDDLDLSSTTIAIIPTPEGSNLPHVGVQCGKDGLCRLLNLADLSGRGAPRHLGGHLQLVKTPQLAEVLTRPATWIDPTTSIPWVFISNRIGTSAYTLGLNSTGHPTLSLQWTTTDGGTSPIIANGVLYNAQDHLVRALDPTTGRTLWSSGAIGNIHWQTPILVNGTLYICDRDSNLTAYAIDARR